MQAFSSEKIESEIKTFIREWVKLLAEDKLDEAVQLLDATAEKKAVNWTPALLKEVLCTYGDESQTHRINPPQSMNLNSEKIYFYYRNDGTGVTAEYDLPIDGEWSDLTATFFFRQKEDGYTVHLQDIHVL